MAEPTRDDAWVLVCEWISSDSLRKHVLGVEAAMRAYARKDGEDEELWAIAGLVHDLDYERYPDLETGHPRQALKELEQRGYPQEVIDAVAGHADFLHVPREQLERGAEELGVEMNEHIQAVIDALAERADELGLGPREGSTAESG